MASDAAPDKNAHVATVKSAVGHWWHQRLTAIALLPLSFWLLVFLHKALNAAYADTLSWLASPLNLLAIAVWTLAVVYHAALGVQVVIEDYVSTIPARHLAIRASNLLFLILGVAALAALTIIFTTK